MFVIKRWLDYTNSFTSVITHSLELILFTSEFICLVIPFPSFDCRMSYNSIVTIEEMKLIKSLSLLLSVPSNALFSPNLFTTCFSFHA